ncbi:MAG: putative acyl-CoA carboxylase, Biotin/lipoyl carrier domain protein [Enterovirga sp.]|nr:putative acyl-CoA carboxylase, Biotin/lipoyl carrier domain protein [Enterovirga sp.]
MPTTLLHDDTPILVDIVARVPELAVEIDGVQHRVAARSSADPRAFSLLIDGAAHEGWVYRGATEIHVRHAGRTTIFAVPQRSAAGSARAGNDIRADMPGVVVSVHCAAGQAVGAGETLLTVESMKLQAALSAPRDAVVDRVHVVADEAFERGAVLLSFRIEAE